MTTLQAQARALGEPSRHRIFTELVEAGRPLGIGELTARFDLHHNAIRRHLAKLVEADLVVERTAPPTGRGRPRLLYEPSPLAESRWGAVGPYERLSRMLAEVIRTGRPPREVGRDEGRRRVVPPSKADPRTQLCELLARDGFAPEPGEADTDVVLRRCPFESTALVDAATVCALHLGIAEGLAERLPGIEVVDLAGGDPRGAGCVLRVRCGDGDGAGSR